MQEEIKLTHTGVLNKDGKKTVRVRFEREQNGKTEYAEGIMPACIIEKQDGFSREEIILLENYMRSNKKNILEKAMAISTPIHWFGGENESGGKDR